MTDTPGIIELCRQLPRERLSAAAREALSAAEGCRDAAALRAAVRQATGELLRRGDLVRVAVEGGSTVHGPLFLLRGTSRMIDLSALTPGVEKKPAAPPTPARPAARPQSGVRFGMPDVPDLLDAMERAQDLSVGDPRADEPAVVIDRILMLLRRFVPDMDLNAQLTAEQPADADANGLVPTPPPDSMPFWLRHRCRGQSLWIPDIGELPQPMPGTLDPRLGQDAVTAVVPLVSPIEGDGEVGLLYVTAASEWTPERLLPLAARLADFVARRWHCQRDVNRRVLTDSLTGIRNRAFFDSHFPLEIERAQRGGFPVTLVISDLDHFKQVNDTYGHNTGDLVLQTVARQMQLALRRIDYVCRIGGEEFAFILPYTSLDESREVLARVVGRPYRVSLPPELGVGVLAVTMSYGVVTFPDAGTSVGELHRKADSMLYQAKELGRNRCCLWVADGHHQQLSPSLPDTTD